MKKYTAILLLLISELLFMRLWFVCKELKDFFYFSIRNVQLIIIDHIHNDGGLPILFVRMLHNKATVGIVELIRHYLSFWDIRFLVPFISPLGFIAVLLGFWYILRRKMPILHRGIMLFVLLSIPLIEMIAKPQVPFEWRTIILATPYVLLSVYGIWHFLTPKQPMRYGIFIALLLLSIWWFVAFQNELTNLCVNP